MCSAWPFSCTPPSGDGPWPGSPTSCPSPAGRPSSDRNPTFPDESCTVGPFGRPRLLSAQLPSEGNEGDMEPFEAVATRANGTAVVAVTGEVDLYTAPRLCDALDAAI